VIYLHVFECVSAQTLIIMDKSHDGTDYVPKFHYASTVSSMSLVLSPTPEAHAVATAASCLQTQKPVKSPEVVATEARRACRGNVMEELILVNSQLQFGKYREID